MKPSPAPDADLEEFLPALKPSPPPPPSQNDKGLMRFWKWLGYDKNWRAWLAFCFGNVLMLWAIVIAIMVLRGYWL